MFQNSLIHFYKTPTSYIVNDDHGIGYYFKLFGYGLVAVCVVGLVYAGYCYIINLTDKTPTNLNIPESASGLTAAQKGKLPEVPNNNNVNIGEGQSHGLLAGLIHLGKIAYGLPYGIAKALNPLNYMADAEDTKAKFDYFMSLQDSTQTANRKLYPYTVYIPFDPWYKKNEYSFIWRKCLRL